MGRSVMRILVVGSCSGRKSRTHRVGLTRDDFDDAERLRALEHQLAEVMLPASLIYTGEQHRRMMRGVWQLREVFGAEAFAVRIVSGGYGVIAEDRLIAPYDLTFNSMSRREARSWSDALGIAAGVRAAIRGSDLVVLLLGARYLDSVQPPLAAREEQRLV